MQIHDPKATRCTVFVETASAKELLSAIGLAAGSHEMDWTEDEVRFPHPWKAVSRAAIQNPEFGRGVVLHFDCPPAIAARRAPKIIDAALAAKPDLAVKFAADEARLPEAYRADAERGV